MSKKTDSYYYAGYREGGLRDKKKIIIPIVIAAVVAVIAIAVCVYVFAYAIPHGQSINTVTVSTYPEKLQYYVTDKSDFSGLKISVQLHNGDTYTVDGSECEVTGFDSSKPVESQPIYVKYQDYSCVFYVKINALPELVKTPTHIELTTLPKTEYKVGENLDITGGIITLYYSDDSTYRINLLSRHVYDFDTSNVGEYDIKVKYVDVNSGMLYETTYKITVAANEAESGT